MKRISRPEPTTRSCLKCSKPFESLGPTNRLCDTCNRENSYVRMPRILECPKDSPSAFDNSHYDAIAIEPEIDPTTLIPPPTVKEDDNDQKKLSWKERNQKGLFGWNRIGP